MKFDCKGLPPNYEDMDRVCGSSGVADAEDEDIRLEKTMAADRSNKR